jgi:hypothetical protein
MVGKWWKNGGKMDRPCWEMVEYIGKGMNLMS